jgi:hypothetical protein
MSARPFEPAIRNWQSQPCAGGWGFVFTAPNGQQKDLVAHNPFRIVEMLTAFLRLNNWYVSDAHTWAIANAEWCRKDPARALQAVTLAELPQRDELVPVKSEPRHEHWMDTKPEKWGPQAWLYMNLFGAKFDKAAWDSMIQYVSILIDPRRSLSTGCDRCHREWQAILKDHPPGDVSNEQQAAAWAFEAHNRVSGKLGRVPMRWKDAAKRFCWKVSI